MARRKMTTKQMERWRESYCPFCGGDSPYFGSVEIDGDTAFQRASCGDCGEDWAEVYTFAHVYRDRNGDELVPPTPLPA